MSIITDLSSSFKRGDALIKLIYANVVVFLLVKIIEVVSFLAQSNFSSWFIHYLMCPALPENLALQPWSIFTYMFLHQGFLHILFNLLWLYWIGIIFIDFLNGKRLVAVYIFGGISGAFLYMIAYNVMPVFIPEMSYMLGASASVMAVVLAITMYVPDYTLYLFLIGPVKLKWVALVSVVLDVIMLTDGNPGGHIAHLGGALFGIYWGYRLKKGKDITRWSYTLYEQISGFFIPKKKVKLHYKNQSSTPYSWNSSNNTGKTTTSELNNILDKISKSGYDSLSASEKEKLFNASKKE